MLCKELKRRKFVGIDQFHTATAIATILDGHLGGGFLRNHDFSGETKNWLEF